MLGHMTLTYKVSPRKKKKKKKKEKKSLLSDSRYFHEKVYSPDKDYHIKQ
jgi:hypothetical protein